MHSSTKRELLSGFQYLLIGIIAEGVVLTWFNSRPIKQKMLIWVIVAFALSIARFLILGVGGMYRRNQWMTISKRNWR